MACPTEKSLLRRQQSQRRRSDERLAPLVVDIAALVVLADGDQGGSGGCGDAGARHEARQEGFGGAGPALHTLARQRERARAAHLLVDVSLFTRLGEVDWFWIGITDFSVGWEYPLALAAHAIARLEIRVIVPHVLPSVPSL